MKPSICFLGAGNMGEALIKGCLQSIPKNCIAFIENNIEKAKKITDTYNIKKLSSFSDINNYQTLIIAIKPQTISSVINELSSKVSSSTLIVSIVAGVSISFYQKHFVSHKIIRVMPNAPCLINKGISVISSCEKCTIDDEKNVAFIFNTTGKTMFMEESKINAVTALSGSGPAYFYHFVDTYAKQAVALGISYDDALILMTNTMLGAAEMLLQTHKSTQELISQVRSPGGTTEAGLQSLQTTALDEIIKISLTAAYKRASELNLKE